MPSLTTNTTCVDGVTFVEVVVDAERSHRIRVDCTFEGPVLPPRENGRPVAGWDENGVTTAVPAGRSPLGFATTAEPSRPVVELTAADPLDGDDLPAGVAAWLERVEARIERAEALSAADDLPSATAAVRDAGGLAAVESLVAEVERDRRLLARLSVVPDRLCARAERLEVPREAFARLLKG